MPAPLSRTADSIWSYTWGFAIVFVLLGVLLAVFWMIRKWYVVEQEDSCDWRDSLTEYRELRQKGLITPEEFQKIKRQFISRDQSLVGLIQVKEVESKGQSESEKPSDNSGHEESKDET